MLVPFLTDPICYDRERSRGCDIELLGCDVLEYIYIKLYLSLHSGGTRVMSQIPGVVECAKQNLVRVAYYEPT